MLGDDNTNTKLGNNSTLGNDATLADNTTPFGDNTKLVVLTLQRNVMMPRLVTTTPGSATTPPRRC
jgi:hypothetical protein